MRYLIVSASMGAGHDGVARELGRRLSGPGVDVDVVDLLDFLPFGVGPALRGAYRWMVRRAPWLYEAIYRLFFAPCRWAAPASPVVLLATPGLRRLIAERQPDGVISTFHLAGQAIGRLRGRGELTAPSAVILVDFAVHRLWLAPGNDLYLCTHPSAAEAVRQALGGRALSVGPLVPNRFRSAPSLADQAAVRDRYGLPRDRPLILIAGGSLGLGSGVRSAARTLAADGRYTPVVLCGRNDRLRAALGSVDGVIALGWVDDMPSLLKVASAVVENAGGGLTCAEAFAVGAPVITYRPIAGHGRAGGRVLAAVGLATLADRESDLLAALATLVTPGPHRDRRVARAGALFADDPIAPITDLMAPGTTPEPVGPVTVVAGPPAAGERAVVGLTRDVPE